MIEIVSYRRTGHLAGTPHGQARPADGSGMPGHAAPDAGRLAWADTAKGICIILVVMMHTTLGLGQEMGREGFLHTVVAFAKPFRMPDFFLISGLFLSRVVGRDWRSYADKRVVHFFYFYLLWLVIQSAIKFTQVSDGTVQGFGHHLLVSLVQPYSTLWFIYLLAVFSVATKLLRGVPGPFLLGCAAVLQILPVDTPSELVNEFCERWVFFLAGYLFAPHVFRLADAARRHVVLALAGLAVWALVNGALAMSVVDVGRLVIPAELPVVGLLLGVAGAMAIVTVASLLTAANLAAPLRYCGQNSIAIYLTFFLPMAAARFAIVKTGAVADVGVAATLVTAFAVVLPLVLERLSRGTVLDFLYRRPAWAHIPPAREPRLTLQPAQ